MNELIKKIMIAIEIECGIRLTATQIVDVAAILRREIANAIALDEIS